MLRRLTILAALALLATAVMADVAAAKGGLGIRKARSVTLEVAQRAAIEAGYDEAYAGGCKRRSKRKVVCWGAIVKGNYGAAQKVRVTKKRGKIRAKRFGRVVEGQIRGESKEEWAVCTPDGACVGS